VTGVTGVGVGVKICYESEYSSSNIGTGVNRKLTGFCDIFSDINISAGD